VEQERLEARQVPRWSDAEAAETTELADYGSVRRAWEDRQVTREIIGYYSGHLDAKGSAPHEAGGCKGSYRWNRFHAAALRIAWHNGGPRWGAILAIWASWPLQNGQRGG
jgi:hypothetical protein